MHVNIPYMDGMGTTKNRSGNFLKDRQFPTVRPRPKIARLLILQFFDEFALCFHPFLHLVHCNGQPLVLIVRCIASLCCLGDLGILRQLPQWHFLIAVKTAECAAMGVCCDREPIGDLNVPVAASARQEGWSLTLIESDRNRWGEKLQIAPSYSPEN